MANKSIKDFPESTSPSGEWFVLVDNGTGCYYKVKLKNLPGGGFTTTSSTTTAASGTTSTTTTSAGGTTTTTTTATPPIPPPESTTTSSTTTLACVPPITDVDVIAFKDATGITDCTILVALQDLVTNLKIGGESSIWNDLFAIYPFVGGTANTNKYNLKNPADTNAAFRLSFFGTVNHSANGVQFTGGTGNYANTYFDITKFTSGGMSTGIYVRNTGVGGAYDMGVTSPSMTNAVATNTGLTRFYPNTNSFFLTWAPDANPPGLIVGQVSSTTPSTSSTAQIYRNGVVQNAGTTPNDEVPQVTYPWFIGAANNAGVSTGNASNQYAFAFFGKYMDGSKMGNLYTYIQAFQTALGRAV